MINEKNKNRISELTLKTEMELRKQNLLEEHKRLEELSTIDIEILIGDIDSEIHSGTYINYMIVPFGLVFSAAIGVYTVKIHHVPYYEKLMVFLYIAAVFAFLNIIGSRRRKTSKKQVYLKNLLKVYLKYER